MDLELLDVFRTVAEARSFTAAAQRLGRDKARVSRMVRALEASLGVTLFARTTRNVRLTAEGEALHQKIAAPLAALAEATTALPDRGAAPSGAVTITCTPDVGRALLAPLLPAFRARYPAVAVRVLLREELVDLTAVDLALRLGRPGTGAFVARKLRELEIGFFASLAYLERRGFPRTLDELASHEGLWAEPPRGTRAFAPRRPPPRPAIASTDFGLLAEIARAGGGIAALPTYLAARDVATGALHRILPDVTVGGAPLFLISPPVRGLAPRVAALRDHLREGLAAAP